MKEELFTGFESGNDIIIPEGKVGEQAWNESCTKLLEKFQEVYELEFISVSKEDFQKIEKAQQIKIPAELKDFYLKFGIFSMSDDFLPLDKIVSFSAWNEGLDVESFLNEDEFELANYLVVFSECPGEEKAFCFHEKTGELYFFDNGSEPFISKLFESISDYLKACLILVQEDLFIDEESAEEIVEEKLIAIFGNEKIIKWLY